MGIEQLFLLCLPGGSVVITYIVDELCKLRERIKKLEDKEDRSTNP